MSTGAVLPSEAQQILKSFEGSDAYRHIPTHKRETLHVLIIDDDCIDFEILERCLSKIQRYETCAFHAKNIVQGRAIAETHTIDIAFIEYNLGMDCGLRAIQHIGGRYGDCPIVLVSNRADHHIQEQALNAGAINHLDKNHLNPSVLETTICSTLYTHQIEKELQSTVDKLNQATKAKENFFAHMSHDLKTPLNAILGYSEALKIGAFGSIPSTRALEGIENINVAGNRLLETINTLITRIASGEYIDETVFEYADIINIVSQAASSVRQFADSEHQTISLKHDASHCFIDCNIEQMTHAITNLLTNAIKYSPKGSQIDVRTSISNDKVIISISDTGIGMTQNQLQTALKNQGRVDLPADIAREGAGIGLTIVKTAVKNHRGTLKINSVSGQGSKFKILLPKCQ